MLGFQKVGVTKSKPNNINILFQGTKLPSGVFRNPSRKDPFFVFEAVNCLGNENNIFDCELSPWGVEGCDDEDILAVACTNENMEDNFRLSALRDESHKITNALSNLLGLPSRKKAVHMIPILSFYNHKYGFCLSKNFGNLEATHLCHSQGYECGIPNFDNFVTTQSLEKQSK